MRLIMDSYIMRHICETLTLPDLYQVTRSGPPMAEIACAVYQQRVDTLSHDDMREHLLATVRENRIAHVRWLLHSHEGCDTLYEHLQWAIIRAAECGHTKLCHMVMELDPGEELDLLALCAAALHGSHDIAQAIHESSRDLDYNMMLVYAALGGHLDLCDQAIQWGATKLELMLTGAIFGGHLDLGVAAVERGVRDLVGMMYAEILMGHHTVLHELAKHEFKKRSTDENHANILLLYSAWCHGKVDFAINSYYSTSMNHMFFGAALGGRLELCREAIRRGVSNSAMARRLVKTIFGIRSEIPD
jgi:hypothetical protein